MACNFSISQALNLCHYELLNQLRINSTRNLIDLADIFEIPHCAQDDSARLIGNLHGRIIERQLMNKEGSYGPGTL